MGQILGFTIIHGKYKDALIWYNGLNLIIYWASDII